uniref:Uncharacterized protein n=1 Tax=Anguilla anguilla TaxID=7936 RepID=A0A0E9VCV2_ANGAN
MLLRPCLEKTAHLEREKNHFFLCSKSLSIVDHDIMRFIIGVGLE